MFACIGVNVCMCACMYVWHMCMSGYVCVYVWLCMYSNPVPSLTMLQHYLWPLVWDLSFYNPDSRSDPEGYPPTFCSRGAWMPLSVQAWSTHSCPSLVPRTVVPISVQEPSAVPPPRNWAGTEEADGEAFPVPKACAYPVSLSRALALLSAPRARSCSPGCVAQ